MSTEEFWEGVEHQESLARKAKYEKNMKKSSQWKEKIKKFYEEESMHHHVGEYNRYLKKLHKESLTVPE
jgi:hypothetical protein